MLSGDTLSAAAISAEDANERIWDDKNPTQDATYTETPTAQSPNWQQGSIA